MTKLYKLTDEKFQTYGGKQWGEGITHEASGKGGLCGPGWLHAYLSPELAVLLNPIHAKIGNPVLWEAEGEIGLNDRDLKVGCTKMTTLRRISLPAATIEQRVKFGILCALAVYRDEAFGEWAWKWLSGEDRSRAAAEAAAEAARAARAAAEAAWTARAARAAARAARAARAAARAAAEAAWTAAEAKASLDLVAIAREALA